jgi:hypothetical protein
MVHALCKAHGLPEGEDSELEEPERETRPENLSRDPAGGVARLRPVFASNLPYFSKHSCVFAIYVS